MDVWYHGSIYKFDTSPILTHFGTEKAGMDAIGKQLRRHPRDRNGGFRHSNLTVTAPRLHAVEFTEKKWPKASKDFGSTTKLALAKALDDICGYSRNNGYFIQFYEHHHQIMKGKEKNEIDHELHFNLDGVRDAFLAKGIKAFLYPNNVEDRGSISLCVVSPNLAGLTRLSYTELSREDLESSLAGTFFDPQQHIDNMSFNKCWEIAYPEPDVTE